MGWRALFPLAAGLDLAGLAKPEQARRISASCERQVRSCAGLIARGSRLASRRLPSSSGLDKRKREREAG
jgi:hypothetical protein